MSLRMKKTRIGGAGWAHFYLQVPRKGWRRGGRGMAQTRGAWRGKKLLRVAVKEISLYLFIG